MHGVAQFVAANFEVDGPSRERGESAVHDIPYSEHFAVSLGVEGDDESGYRSAPHRVFPRYVQGHRRTAGRRRADTRSEIDPAPFCGNRKRTSLNIFGRGWSQEHFAMVKVFLDVGEKLFS